MKLNYSNIIISKNYKFINITHRIHIGLCDMISFYLYFKIGVGGKMHSECHGSSSNMKPMLIFMNITMIAWSYKIEPTL